MSITTGSLDDAGRAVDSGESADLVAGSADLVTVGFPGWPACAPSLAQALAELPPGATAAAYLGSLDLRALGEFDRVEVLKAWDRQQAWTLAQTQAAILAVAGPAPDEIVDHADDFAAEEIALALRLSPRAAGNRVHTARMLHAQLPATAAALHAGTISGTHAMIIVAECTGLPAPTIAAVEAAVLGRAGAQTPAQFGRSVRRAIIAAAPVTAELAHAVANTERGVWLRPEPDGMATLTAYLPAVAARAAYTAIDTAARAVTTTPDADADADADGSLGIDARRADALLALLTGTPTSPGATRPAVEIQVVIDAATLLGLADHPGELLGYGPITAGLARDLATDATWRRLVTDPITGHLLDYGRTTYPAPTPLRAYLQARDRTCRLPGCHQPAHRTDIDHTQPFNRGGHTSATNCACLCRRHHRMKTHAGWQLQLHPDASTTWTSPTGHHYTTPPPTQPDSG